MLEKIEVFNGWHQWLRISSLLLTSAISALFAVTGGAVGAAN
jgi:hypothetical protein